MSAAAAAMGLPKSVLQKAKDAGCPAFKGSRVSVPDATKWLAENKETIGSLPTKEKVQIEKLTEEVRKLRLVNDQKAGLIVYKSDVRASFQACAAKLNQYRGQTESQLAFKFAGITDTNDMRVELKKLWDEIFNVLHSSSDQWKETSL